MKVRVSLFAAVFGAALCAHAATIHIATAENGGDDANDGSEGHPVATLARAVALANEDDTVLFGDGEFEEPAVQVTVDKNITITSQNGPTKTTFRSLHTGVVGNVTDHSGWLFLTNCPNALVSGIYFCGKKTDGTQPTIRTAVYMTETAGTVSNCVFRYLKGGVWHGAEKSATMAAGGMGPAAFMYGGTIVDSLFEDNCSDRNSGRGGAVSMGNTGCTGTPLVDRCRFYRNSTQTYGGAIWEAGGSTIRNSLFCGNYSDGHLAAVGYTYYSNPHLIVNCTAVSNSCKTANQGVERVWTSPIDSLSWKNYSAGIPETTVDPGFVDAANGDFRLAAGSSAIDASVNTTYAKGDFDLDRKARAMGTKADKGCYEFDPTQFSLNVYYEKIDTFAPGRIRFYAVTVGGEMDPEASYWTFDGSEPSATHYDACGTDVTVTLDAGSHTVRFVTTAGGESRSVTKADYVSLLGKTVYVRKGNPTAQSPYESWAHAAAEFSDALVVATAGQTVMIDDGEYTMTSSYTFPSDFAIGSVNGPGKTTFVGGGFSIAKTGCVLSGVRVKGVSSSYGAAVTLSVDSLITNCIFDSCLNLGQYGSGLHMTAGRTVDCVFTNCQSSFDCAHAVSIKGSSALLDRCLVIDSHTKNKSWYTQNSYGAVSVEGGTVRNTLVTKSRMGNCAGIYVKANGKVENCTVASNCVSTATGAAVQLGVASGSVSNTVVALNFTSDGVAANASAVDGAENRFGRCAVPGGFGADSIAGEAMFKDVAKGDFHLRQVSPCVNAAAVQPWMTDAKDLDGNLRVQGRPDIGCYERDRAGLAIMIK